MSETPEVLTTVRHQVAPTPHIEVDAQACARCAEHGCLYYCSAHCFTLEDGEITFRYEGCLECGTCRVMCPQAVRWDYPNGGLGVAFRIG